jgi:hypothetical protein
MPAEAVPMSARTGREMHVAYSDDTRAETTRSPADLALVSVLPSEGAHTTSGG